MNPHAIEDYFAYGYIPEPKTIFKQASKLSPGFSLKLQRGKTTIEPKNIGMYRLINTIR